MIDQRLYCLLIKNNQTHLTDELLVAKATPFTPHASLSFETRRRLERQSLENQEQAPMGRAGDKRAFKTVAAQSPPDEGTSSERASKRGDVAQGGTRCSATPRRAARLACHKKNKSQHTTHCCMACTRQHKKTHHNCKNSRLNGQ